MRQKAQQFMTGVFEHIRHGDEQHQQWLKDKCDSLISRLETYFEEIDGYGYAKGYSAHRR